MLRSHVWFDGFRIRQVLNNHPAYCPPITQNEIDLPLTKARDNFAFFKQDRHPWWCWYHCPAATGRRSIEGFAVFQDPIGEILRGRRPNLADDREPHVNDRTCRSQFFDFRGGIAEI